MRQLLIILSFGSLFGCQGQNTLFINSIERKVYIEDSVYSTTVAYFDTSEVFLLRSQEILQAIEKGLMKENATVTDTSVVYDIFLSDKTKKSVKLFTPHLDNLMRFDGGVDGDETFEVDWWYKEDEIETIIIPSSEFHK